MAGVRQGPHVAERLTSVGARGGEGAGQRLGRGTGAKLRPVPVHVPCHVRWIVPTAKVPFDAPALSRPTRFPFIGF